MADVAEWEGEAVWQAHSVSGRASKAKTYHAIAKTAKQAMQFVLADMKAGKSRAKEICAVKGTIEGGHFAYFPVTCQRVRCVATAEAVEAITQ